VGLAWLILAYRAAPVVPLWEPIPGALYIAMLLMLLAFILLALGLGAGNPTLAGADMILKDQLPVYGVTRITRHPLLWVFALWAIAHLLANGHLAALLLFGAILVTALNGMVSIDRKRRRALGRAWDTFAAATSRVPFAAIVAGRNSLRLEELPVWRIAVGVVLFGAALWLHGFI
ncbi:MAG TPA: NnrU family protein, partial [Stellaceae bacterium]